MLGNKYLFVINRYIWRMISVSFVKKMIKWNEVKVDINYKINV